MWKEVVHLCSCLSAAMNLLPQRDAIPMLCNIDLHGIALVCTLKSCEIDNEILSCCALVYKIFVKSKLNPLLIYNDTLYMKVCHCSIWLLMLTKVSSYLC